MNHTCFKQGQPYKTIKVASHDYVKNRVGRKRNNWPVILITDLWDEVRQTYTEARGLGDFDPDSQAHAALMRQLAQQYNNKYHFVKDDDSAAPIQKILTAKTTPTLDQAVPGCAKQETIVGVISCWTSPVHMNSCAQQPTLDYI